jgi:ketosteroid isomerase-like protein
MVEGSGERCEGKEANRKREVEFGSQIKEFHGANCRSSAVGDGVTFSEWEFDFTFQNGQRVKMEEVARREWKDGKVVNERFYYNAAPPQ